jgi:hypothetical protein
MGQLAARVEGNMYPVAGVWAFALTALALCSCLFYGYDLARDGGKSLILYGLLAITPIAALRLADITYPRHSTGLAVGTTERRSGRWLYLDSGVARSHPAFGTSGLLAALALGLLANIGFRGGEFLLAMPPIAMEGPRWSRILFSAMMLDAIVFSLLYAFAFVMAVRHARGFPRMLFLIWLCDIVSQLFIAQMLAHAAMPPHVVPPLIALLTGNLKKTLISMALWLPYLILSTKVNVTFRRRVLRVAA